MVVDVEAAKTVTTNNAPKWNASGDWFDVCKCNMPCPCIFAQTPSYGDCEGVMAYHIKKGEYGETPLDGLNVLILDYFKGNIWAGETRADIAFFFDERANEDQRKALNMIFTGKAGGLMGKFANLFGEVRGLEYVPIKFEVAEDLAYWSVQIPGKVFAKGEALTGPMTPPGKRVQTINAPGSEVGPGSVATWGTAVLDEVYAPHVRFEWKRSGRSSKHIPFDWTGP
jgi:hypothetical protein